MDKWSPASLQVCLPHYPDANANALLPEMLAKHAGFGERLVRDTGNQHCRDHRKALACFISDGAYSQMNIKDELSIHVYPQTCSTVSPVGQTQRDFASA